MSQHFAFMDCRGLSAPLTLLRIKQAMIARADVSLPLEVVIDAGCRDGARIAESLTEEASDIRLFHLTESAIAPLGQATPETAAPTAHA